ncbi:MAG: SET domain-containing protein [Blastocatellia bacterium]|nr:SET domain-containing protein [Blastocatellia bacterium]
MSVFESAGFEVFADEGKGNGLFTSREILKGDTVYLLDYWSAEIMPMHMTNHSCEPNSRFNDAGELIALRDIEMGEEITYDYLHIPLPASPWNFACHCKSDICLGWIRTDRK